MKRLRSTRCEGCGRLCGSRTEAECPCWRAVNEGAVIPDRLVERVKRAKRRGFA